MDALESKAQTLWELYRDKEHAASAMGDIEAIRKRADYYGLACSLAIFGLNLSSRLTMRSRKLSQKKRQRKMSNK